MKMWRSNQKKQNTVGQLELIDVPVPLTPPPPFCPHQNNMAVIFNWWYRLITYASFWTRTLRIAEVSKRSVRKGTSRLWDFDSIRGPRYTKEWYVLIHCFTFSIIVLPYHRCPGYSKDKTQTIPISQWQNLMFAGKRDIEDKRGRT